jgi:hypothetical protein
MRVWELLEECYALDAQFQGLAFLALELGEFVQRTADRRTAMNSAAATAYTE